MLISKYSSIYDYPWIHGYLLCEGKRVSNIFDSFIKDAFDMIFEYKYKYCTDIEKIRWLEQNPVYSGWSFDSNNQIAVKTNDKNKFHGIYFSFHIKFLDGRMHQEKRTISINQRNFNVPKDVLEHDSIIIDVYTWNFLKEDYPLLINGLVHELSHILDYWTVDNKPIYDDNDIVYSRISKQYYEERGIDTEYIDEFMLKEIYIGLYILSKTEQDAVIESVPEYIKRYGEFNLLTELSTEHFVDEEDMINWYMTDNTKRCGIKLSAIQTFIKYMRDKFNESQYLFPVLFITTAVEHNFFNDKFKLYSDYTLAKKIINGTFKMDNYIMKSMTKMMDEIEKNFNDYLKKVFNVIRDTFREMNIWKRIYPVKESRRIYKCTYNHWYPSLDNKGYIYSLNKLHEHGEISEDEMYSMILFNYADNLLNIVESNINVNKPLNEVYRNQMIPHINFYKK